MGLFDEVAIQCPNCGKTTTFQSKYGPCNCERYSLEDAPLLVIADINDEGKSGRLYCEYCEVQLEVPVRFIATVQLRGSIVNNDWREV
jgi:transcription elongation factor Elf1